MCVALVQDTCFSTCPFEYVEEERLLIPFDGCDLYFVGKQKQSTIILRVNGFGFTRYCNGTIISLLFHLNEKLT